MSDAVGRSGVVADMIADAGLYRVRLRSALRDDVRFDRWRTAKAHTSEDILRLHADLVAELFASGWNRFGWPDWAGGFGGNEIHRAVLYEELCMAGLPIPEQCLTLETVGPAVVGRAAELAKRFLPAYLSGQEWWGQGFSESEAGSDLAALRTRGVIDGSSISVSGHKIWTSQGTTAKRLLCLVRTGDAGTRHRGLTAVLLDTDHPRITIRPIALASGRRELAEVFLDNVTVPLERIIGPVGGGWEVAMYLMQWERSMYCYASMSRTLALLQRLRDWMADNGVDDQVYRQRLAGSYVHVSAAKARGLFSLRRLSATQQLGPEASVDKLLCGLAEQTAQDLVVEVMGVSDASLSPDAVHDGLNWAADWWYSRAATIMGGSAEIQRTIIADRVMGLPK